MLLGVFASLLLWSVELLIKLQFSYQLISLSSENLRRFHVDVSRVETDKENERRNDSSEGDVINRCFYSRGAQLAQRTSLSFFGSNILCS